MTNSMRKYISEKKHWAGIAGSARLRIIEKIESGGTWIQKLGFIATLAITLILFERLAPAIILGALGYIVLSRMSQPVGRVVRKVVTRMEIEPEPILPIPAPEKSNVIPISNSFSPAWKGMDDFLKSVLEMIRTQFDFQTANIFLRESDPNMLVQRAYSTTTRSVARLATIRIGHGLVGWVAKNKRPIVVKNLNHEGRSMGYYRVPGENIASFAAAPILVDDELVGVISLDHNKANAFSSPETEEALTSMAGMLARVLGAEEVMETRTREADKLRETKRIIRAAYEAEEIDSAARDVLKEIVTLADFHSIACYLLDQSRIPSRRAAIGFNGIEGNMIKDPIMKRTVEQAVLQCSPFRLEGLALQAQYRASGASSGIAVPELLVAMPIFFRGNPLGAIVFEVMDKKILDDRLEGILDEVVNNLGGSLLRTYRAAEAMDNSQKERELIKYLNELVLADGVEEVWEKLFSIFISRTGATSAAAFRCEKEKFTIESVAGCTLRESEVPRDGGLLGWTALARKPVIVSKKDRRRIPIEDGESFLAFSIGNSENPRSVVILGSNDRNAFNEESCEIVKSISEVVMPVFEIADKLELARTAAETDNVTGLLNETGFLKRLGMLAMTSPVSVAIFKAEGFEEIVSEFGRKESNSYLRRIATVIDSFAGRKAVLARLDGARFAVGVKENIDSLSDEIIRVVSASSVGSYQGISIHFISAEASSSEELSWKELLDAADSRLCREKRNSAVGVA